MRVDYDLRTPYCLCSRTSGIGFTELAICIDFSISTSRDALRTATSASQRYCLSASICFDLILLRNFKWPVNTQPELAEVIFDLCHQYRASYLPHWQSNSPSPRSPCRGREVVVIPGNKLNYIIFSSICVLSCCRFPGTIFEFWSTLQLEHKEPELAFGCISL